MYVCIYVSLSLFMYVCMYTYIYTYTHTRTHTHLGNETLDFALSHEFIETQIDCNALAFFALLIKPLAIALSTT